MACAADSKISNHPFTFELNRHLPIRIESRSFADPYCRVFLPLSTGTNNYINRARNAGVDWCKANLQELSYSAQDRTKWNEIIKET